ncbi:hypothetical protein NHX12_024057 [Muraenolepis orangiensis]|uniref:Uncharacterized protein n=1 Tax=Muraenolepis orangiensis TaxID=630683 RepID=A0A9Q0IQP0_9TELE|nr:hypothetical protein NHX12_024057 [Muraenolepis orangiensis]
MLSNPPVSPVSPRVFSGSLVHGLLNTLSGGRTTESLLGGGALSGQLYCSLLDAVSNCSSKTQDSLGGRKRGNRRRGGGRGRGGGGRGGGGRGGGGGEEEGNEEGCEEEGCEEEG